MKNKKLEKRLESEFQELKDECCAKGAKYTFDHVFELAVKEAIAYKFAETTTLNDTMIEQLDKASNVLDYLYSCFVSTRAGKFEELVVDGASALLTGALNPIYRNAILEDDDDDEIDSKNTEITVNKKEKDNSDLKGKLKSVLQEQSGKAIDKIKSVCKDGPTERDIKKISIIKDIGTIWAEGTSLPTAVISALLNHKEDVLDVVVSHVPDKNSDGRLSKEECEVLDAELLKEYSKLEESGELDNTSMEKIAAFT